MFIPIIVVTDLNDGFLQVFLSKIQKRTKILLENHNFEMSLASVNSKFFIFSTYGKNTLTYKLRPYSVHLFGMYTTEQTITRDRLS